MKSIELLFRLAKIREDQAMARARRVTGQMNQTAQFKQQVLEYAKDYENQILDGAKKGTSIAFIKDANAFREKLLLSSVQMDPQIEGLNRASDQALQEAAQARMRTKGLGKLVDKAAREIRKKQERSEINQFEDSYVARLSLNTGTKDA